MHCQKETVKKIIEKEADYVIQVKGNQQALLDSIKSEMEHYESARTMHHQSSDADHQRTKSNSRRSPYVYCGSGTGRTEILLDGIADNRTDLPHSHAG